MELELVGNKQLKLNQYIFVAATFASENYSRTKLVVYVLGKGYNFWGKICLLCVIFPVVIKLRLV